MEGLEWGYRELGGGYREGGWYVGLRGLGVAGVVLWGTGGNWEEQQ